MMFRARSLVRRVLAWSVLLALGTALAPVPGTAADRHCATQSGMQAMPGMEHHAPATPPADRGLRSQHECDHCPPAECLAHDVCGGTISASWPATRTVRDAGARRGADALVWYPTYSQRTHPPTPPPTALL